MKTYSPKAADIDRKWHIVDASGQTLGRLASEVASILRGKHKPMFAPHMDTGDYVIVINASKIRLTGKKLTDKYHHHHSGYPGGIKSIPYGKLLEKQPEKVIELAVKGMLPHNKLGRVMFKKLKVYAGQEHPHEAQQPQEYKVSG